RCPEGARDPLERLFRKHAAILSRISTPSQNLANRCVGFRAPAARLTFWRAGAGPDRFAAAYPPETWSMGGASVSITSYEEAVANHEWRVPERYNIAQDVCDKHPADKLAMIHEHFDGTVREVHWGELQELSNRFANVLRSLGV